ncbi:hypothetical protein OG992_18570 [Micromonospora sp. NBC_00362]|uniref:hypothetical protein n=1 Tax=Micromonospora sp. NBC_00362 TaxID=2975975 RepID=UPI002257F70E|nr:hypothetical protein [Micromonospora sp. NBC_00362]MCX5119193.1 hypothetical protein [Micromonospora sp. NBC_00362]
MSTPKEQDTFAVRGERIALATAVLLTAKGEFDLAVLAHFAVWIAWLYPLMLDVYVITAFHKRRWLDVAISLALMLFSQIAVHLVPVFITEGEETPWGLVMAVACIAPIVVVRVKALTGKTRAEREAEERDNSLAEDARKARAEAADADRKRAAAEVALRAEERKSADAVKLAEAEAAGRKRAEERAAAEAEARAEESRESEAEIARLIGHAEDVQASARDARAQAAEQSELAARISGQLDEARLLAERAIAEKLNAEQHISALTDAHTALSQELERVRQSYARLQSRTENPGRRQAEISAPPKRKTPPALPPALPVDVPPVEGVSSATVARVISAFRANPNGTQKQIAAAAGTTDRTVRTVLNNIPADHPALAIESAAATKES